MRIAFFLTAAAGLGLAAAAERVHGLNGHYLRVGALACALGATGCALALAGR